MGSYRWIALAALALGCREQTKPTADRVHIETELVEQVCRGTIVHAESELARIEAELELAPMSEQVELRVVDPERIGEWCAEDDELCVIQPPRQVIVGAEVFDRTLTRELVRDRLARSAVSSTKPMFFEGVATALTRPMCTAESSWDPPSPNELLSKTLGTSLSEEELYLAGELLRWMIDTHGPDAVLEFMATLNRSDSPDQVRLAYLERFGSAIDLDLYAHWRPADEPLAPERAGCVAPELPRGDSPPRLIVDATFDCDSARVRNAFAEPERVFVEWTLTVDERTAGWYRLSGELPEGVTLALGSCECRHDIGWTHYPPGTTPWHNFDLEFGEHLEPGVYRVRAYGPIGSSLHYEILAPCDYGLQNCPAGQQCGLGRSCEDEVEDPGADGEPCWPPFGAVEAPLPCDVGLICVGPISLEQEGICMPWCDEPADMGCPGELSCESFSVCTETCDPFAPVCAEGWSCVPNRQTGGGGCHPIPPGDRGLLEPCSQLDFACGPGLVCETLYDLEGCHNPDAWIDFSGCCTPICDPAAAEPSCPPELPNCEAANEDDLLGTCWP
ncbi:MAG TPA: hypothetical protein VM869_32285 [Enhygromyxa sp.]|nr:hypothetical protein [Enhygromyxa sp.]